MNFATAGLQHDRGKVVVAMSGGVDSSASALLLAEQGFEVIGVAMQVWDYRAGGNKNRATCCAPGDFDDARGVSQIGEFPFYVFDFEESFQERVIAPFVSSYLSGRTPNPCLDCNRKVKFWELRRRALSLGADYVATGHYARIREKSDGSLGLFTGRDLGKDQSYFLYALTQAELAQTLFPVGDMLKPDVRKFLSAKGVKTAEKAESQDICFVPGETAEFIRRHSPVGALREGNFRNSSGEVLGKHEGIHQFTVGQRRGIGISNPKPLYVLQVDPMNQDVVVGEKEELEKESFEISGMNWIPQNVPTGVFEARVKLRYRHEGVLCRGEVLGSGRAKLRFVSDWSPVSPGQAAVFYSPDTESDGAVEVLGGGIIEG